MISYSDLHAQLDGLGFAKWASEVDKAILATFYQSKHGHFKNWQNTLESLPEIKASSIDLNQSSIQIGETGDCDQDSRQELQALLKTLWPWRKGPYNLFGIDIDTEWRSDFKWDRVKPHISSLQNRVVLDVGCGSGYHCWRMEGEGAKLVIGIDPTLVYCFQYLALQRYIGSSKTFVLPFSTDTIPQVPMMFDSIFSMGVLYHRRSPIDHLTQMWEWLNWEGELVLETLIIEGDEGQVLMPEKRYAKMRNVWFIPTPATLELWLRRCNFVNIRCVDINQTSFEEQRVTRWMHFESLADFLDPDDPNKTIEGYPAPKRAILIANKPEKPRKNLDNA